MLTITDLVKRYPTGQRALNGVSLTVDLPQVVAIIGPSGAGKSTLIRCVNRLVEPTSGSVVLDGTDITKLSRRELRRARRRMGMIFQEYNLVERLTVMENLLSGRLGYVGFWRTYRRRYPPEDIRMAYGLLDRMHDKGIVNKDDLRIIWQSRLFPTTSYGYAHNLTPALQAAVTDAFLSFDWTGTGLKKEFGKKSDQFIPITFMEHWADIRTIQETNGVIYTKAALEGLKLKKKKKKKKAN